MGGLSTSVATLQAPALSRACEECNRPEGKPGHPFGGDPVNWFPFDMDAWGRWTKEFGHTHRGIYVTLLTWYYATSGPLPLSWERLYRIGETHTAPEKEALHEVLGSFFECTEGGWRNIRADEELQHFYSSRDADVTLSRDKSVTGVTRHASRTVTPSRIRNDASRQRRYRDMKTVVADRLNKLGATCSRHQPFTELQQIAESLGVVIDAEFLGRDETSFVTRDLTTEARSHSNSMPAVSGARVNEGVTVEGVPEVESAEKSGIPTGFSLVATPAGEACRRMKQQGMHAVNPSHPKLVALLEAGATADELANTAAEAVASGKGFAWVLATVKGRREDAARAAQEPRMPQQGHRPGRSDAKTDRLRAWVPELVAKPPAPDFSFYDDKVPHVPAD